MTRPVHGLFESELARMTQMLGGRADHARFLFDDLAAEADYANRAHGAPFCLALRSAVLAFQLDFTQSRDAAVAHTAAVARIEALAMLSGRR
jgi:hypothetical protein